MQTTDNTAANEPNTIGAAPVVAKTENAENTATAVPAIETEKLAETAAATPKTNNSSSSKISEMSKGAATVADPAKEELEIETGVECEAKKTNANGTDAGDEHDDLAYRNDNGVVEKSILGSMTMQHKILTMAALSMSVFIGSLDQTIIASSLPNIAEQFNALSSVSWIATGFLLASTAMQPLYGRLSDIFGRVETLMFGMVIFLIGSAVSGAANSMGMLIGGRVVQGLGASALMSLVMVIVSDISIERERAKVTSVFAAIWAASSVLGPVLGGVFTESKGGWPWAFYFSLPVGGLAGIFIVLFLRLPRPQGSFREKLKRVDFFGMIVLVCGIVMILLALSFGEDSTSWSSPKVLCLLIFGIVVVGIFVIIEWKIPAEPIMPLRLYKNRNVGISLLQQIFVGAVMFGPTFYIPMYFSVIQNSSAIKSGLHLLPFILPISLASIVSGFVVSKTGRYREMQWLGGLLLTLGISLLSILNEKSTTGISIGLLLPGGIGIGFLLQPMLLALQTSIQPRDMATGTTLFVAIRSLGGSVGLSIFQTVQQNSISTKLDALILKYPEFVEMIERTADNQSFIHSAELPDDLRADLIGAYVKSLRYVFFAMIPFAAMVLILALFIKHIPLRTRMAKTISTEAKKSE